LDGIARIFAPTSIATGQKLFVTGGSEKKL
jgi:hypothetical protein